MANNKNLNEDVNASELTPEEIESARIAHCDILQNNILDLEKKEKEAKARLDSVQDEIAVHFKAREDAVKNIEYLASDNFRKSKAALERATDVESKANEILKNAEADRGAFLVDRKKSLESIEELMNKLNQDKSDIKALRSNLNKRLKNVEAREIALHGED